MTLFCLMSHNCGKYYSNVLKSALKDHKFLFKDVIEQIYISVGLASLAFS